MSPTLPDPVPTTAEQDARDEQLGAQLDRHLESLDSGWAPPAPGPDSELARLQPLVERLHRLAEGLRTPTTLDYPAVGTRSTLGSQATDGGERGRAADDVPARVGKFQVLRRLGRGGQASTLLALDPDLRRHVVLKLYHSAVTPQEQEMVLREGQALARVRSPYVAQCYSAERDDGVPFLVVEYIPGRNLAEERRARPLTPAQALDLVTRLAEGLAAVHACGLLHRDVKPGNILIGDDDRPRLVDFGLAAPLASEDLAQLSGTLAYMAPEQARRQVERIDARTDLYGLGAVLYDLLAGRPPHVGATQAELLQAATVGDVTPPARLNPRVPPAVNDLCLRCLARDPADRFRSATELADAVRRLRSRPRWPLLAGAAAAVVALVLVVVFVSRSGGPGGVAEILRGDKPPDSPKDGGPKKQEPPRVEDPKKIEVASEVPLPYLKGRKLRRDFPMKLSVIGGDWDSENRTFIPNKDDSGFARDPKTKVYRIRTGQFFRFRVEVGQGAYVALWNIRKDGIYELFPNSDETNNFIPAGETHDLPGGFAIRAATPSDGIEYVHVLAATKPFRNVSLPSFRAAGPAKQYDTVEAQERMTDVLRGLELVPDRRVFSGRAAAAEVVLPLRVVED